MKTVLKCGHLHDGRRTEVFSLYTPNHCGHSEARKFFLPEAFIITAGNILTQKSRWTLQVKLIASDHASVFCQIPENPHKYPHGYAAWRGPVFSYTESTPDGREGFQNIFLRRGILHVYCRSAASGVMPDVPL